MQKIKRVRLRKNSNPYKILKCAALAGGFLIVSALAPAAGAGIVKQMIKDYFRRKSFERQRFLNDLKNLQVRELIDYKELDNDRIEITLTKNGKEKIMAYNIDDLRLKRPARWDGKWRLIIFDIPHYHKKARDAFRRKLKDLKFYPLQKSVYITPYPCEYEVDFLASIFDVRKNILLLYVSHFEGDKKLKNYFQI